MTSIRPSVRRMPAIAIGLFSAVIALSALSCANPLGRPSQSGKGSLAIKVRLPSFPRGSSIASNISSRFLTPQTVSMSAQLLQEGTIVRETSAEPDSEGTFTLAFTEVSVGSYRLDVSASDDSGVYAISRTEIQVNAGNNQQAIVLFPEDPHELAPGNNGGLSIEAGRTGIYSFTALYAGTWTINLSGAPSAIQVFGNDGRPLASYAGGPRIGLPAMAQGDRAYIAVYAGDEARTMSAAAARSPTSNVNPSFGTGGLASILGGVSSSSDVLEDMLELPDGRVAAVGTSMDIAGKNQAFVALFDSQGALDRTFGQDGRIFIEIAQTATESFSCVLQNLSGTINLIIAGRYQNLVNGYYYYFLTRIDLAAGQIDPSFGNQGIFTLSTYFTGTAQTQCSPPDCAVDGSGRILVCLNSVDGSPRFSVMRLTTTGHLDTTFASGSGIASSAGSNLCPVAIAVSSAQDIFIAGHDGDNTYWYLSKLNQNGSGSAMSAGTASFFDAANDTRGIMPPNSSEASLADIRISRIGEEETVYLAGNAYITDTYQMALAAIDPTTGANRYASGIFNGVNCWTARLGINNRATSIAFDAGGNIMLGGYANYGLDQYGAAAKILRNSGAPVIDADFNTDGEFKDLSAYQFPTNAYFEKISKVLYRGTNRDSFLFGGRTAYDKSESDRYDLLLLDHRNTDGTRIFSRHLPLRYQQVHLYAAACLENGSVIAVGDMEYQAIVAKLTPSGALDTAFADGGIKKFAGSDWNPSRFNDVAITPIGDIVAAGRITGGFSCAASLDPNTGQLTMRWGDGWIQSDVTGGEIFSIAIVTDGTILFGERFNPISTAIYSPRILVSNSSNGSFATLNIDIGNSTVSTTRTSGLAYDAASNRLYAAFEFDNAAYLDCYAWNGSTLDDRQWRATLNESGGGSNHSPSVLLDTDGSVYAVWRNNFDGEHTPCLQRFLPSGATDTMRTIGVSSTAGYDFRGAIHPDGRIYISGTQARTGSLPLRGFVSMFNPGNPADTGFGDAGTTFYSDAMNEYSFFSGILINYAGDLVMPGFAQRNGSCQGILVTYR